MIGVKMLVMAKVMPAPTMNAAPRTGAWGREEIWFICRPFRNQFPQGYGRRHRERSAPSKDIGTRQGAIPVLSHPDYDRRLRSCTESADPRQSGAALAGFSPKDCHRRWGLSPRPENVDLKNEAFHRETPMDNLGASCTPIKRPKEKGLSDNSNSPSMIPSHGVT